MIINIIVSILKVYLKKINCVSLRYFLLMSNTRTYLYTNKLSLDKIGGLSCL